MSTEIVLGIIGASGLILSSSIPAMLQSRRLSRRIGNPNGHGSVTNQVEKQGDEIQALGRRLDRIEDGALVHRAETRRGFARLEEMLLEHVEGTPTKVKAPSETDIGSS